MLIDNGKIFYEEFEKAAILIMSLPKDQSSQLLSLLNDDELLEITRTMSSLGPIKSESIESLCMDFIKGFANNGFLVGSKENTKKLLSEILPEDKYQNLVSDMNTPPGKSVWEKILHLDPGELGRYLSQEYPQTIAVIISRLNPEFSAKVMGYLPDELVVEVMQRMIKMEPVRQEALEEIEEALKKVFTNQFLRNLSHDSYKSVADIFNAFDRKSEIYYMQQLEQISPISAQKVKNYLFAFEDLAMLDQKNMQVLIRNIDRSLLALALKGTPKELVDQMTSVMSERAAKLLLDEIQSSGMVRLSEVEEAQRQIVATAKTLSAQGQLFLSSGSSTNEQMVA
jgi:flagellar motor switch protein FliG